jgi:hypothetical protein
MRATRANSCGSAVILSLLFLLNMPSRCAEQESGFLSQGYIYAAPGFMTHEKTALGIIDFGGGADIVLRKNIQAEAEIGYLSIINPPSYLHPPGKNYGVFSIDAKYLRPKGEKWVAFFAGGYTLGFHSETANFINLGGGATYWFRQRQGIRMEIRDYIRTEDFNDHSVSFRLGLALR